MSKEFLPDSNRFDFKLYVYFGGSYSGASTPSKYFLSIESFDTTIGNGGYKVQLKTLASALRWEFEHEREEYGGGHFWTSERTGTDELKIEQIVTDSSFFEEYTQNQNSATFSFATNDVNYIQSIHQQLLQGQTSRQIYNPQNPSLEEQIILELNDFDEFYDTTNTLHHNEEGELVTQFVKSQPIADWLIIEYPDTSGGEVNNLIPDEICTLAAECAVIKCPMGANPVCGACVGIVVICVIERVIDWF